MRFESTALSDALLIVPEVFGDTRGFFLESWSKRDFSRAGLDLLFVQDNHSKSKQGILRGLHYQTQHTQGKLVRVISGAVFDVVVDLRRHSPTFGRWLGEELSAENKYMFWVPPGFAHGFYVLSEMAEFFYKCTDYYHPSSEISIRWDDPELNIKWPLIDGLEPQLSGKDMAGISFASAPKF